MTMDDQRDEMKLRDDASLNTRTAFEAELVEELRLLIAVLPEGSASLCLLPENPEWSCPYFEVMPANDRAAKLIVGAVLDDIHLTIGEVEREFIGFRRGGIIVPGGSWYEGGPRLAFQEPLHQQAPSPGTLQSWLPVPCRQESLVCARTIGRIEPITIYADSGI